MDVLKKYWPWFVFVPLAVAATVLVVVGVTTHEEAGWDERLPRLVGDAPFSVCTGDSVEPLEAAVRHTNERVGFEVFRVSSEIQEHCTAWVVLEAPIDPGGEPGGYTDRLSLGEDGQQCLIGVSNVHGVMVTTVLEHELGHCLGLAHDDFESSLMAPRQEANDDGAPARAWPAQLTEHDVALIRERYGAP